MLDPRDLLLLPDPVKEVKRLRLLVDRAYIDRPKPIWSPPLLPEDFIRRLRSLVVGFGDFLSRRD